MSKVKKYLVTISYKDSDGDICSIRQTMSNYSIGTWCQFFISQGCEIVSVQIPDLFSTAKYKFL